VNGAASRHARLAAVAGERIATSAYFARLWYHKWQEGDVQEECMLDDALVRSALKNVIDPEIGLDIVSLGLVYDVGIDDAGRTITVDMTLTTPACPAGPQILEQARREVLSLATVHPSLENVRINLVWTPFWNPSMMSEDAREELGFF
jgi:metal-sulfur cluster biosynthetic enzyme